MTSRSYSRYRDDLLQLQQNTVIAPRSHNEIP